MIPVKQTILGYPYGNCFAACVASLLEISIEETPSLEDGAGFAEMWVAWLHARGLGMAWTDSKLVQRTIAGYCIAVGKFPQGDGIRKVPHAVVCRDGELVFDPHPAGAFLDGDPEYFVVLYPLNPECLAKIGGK